MKHPRERRAAAREAAGRARSFSKAPQGNKKGAVGSKSPPAYRSPCCFSAQHGSKARVSFQDPFAPMPLLESEVHK